MSINETTFHYNFNTTFEKMALINVMKPYLLRKIGQTESNGPQKLKLHGHIFSSCI